MGEAKRRREAGLGFDPNQKLITGCYIAPAMISDGFAPAYAYDTQFT